MEAWGKVAVRDLMLNLAVTYIRGVVLNLTVICQRCDVKLTKIDLLYEQFWGLVILLIRIDKGSLECQKCSVNLTKINLWYEQFWGLFILLMRIDKVSLE